MPDKRLAKTRAAYVEESSLHPQTPNPKCPKCGEQLYRTKDVGMHQKLGTWICLMNMPGNGCGWVGDLQ